jgi:hypothetical protein
LQQVPLNSALKPVPAPFKKPGFLTFLVKNPSHIFILGVPFFSLGTPESILGVAKIDLANAFSSLAIAGFGSTIVVKGFKGVNSSYLPINAGSFGFLRVFRATEMFFNASGR